MRIRVIVRARFRARMKVRVATGQCVVPGAMAGGGRENARGKNEFARHGGCLAPELGPGSALGSTLGWNQGRV